MFRRNKTAVAHQLPRTGKSTECAEFGDDRYSCHLRHASEWIIRLGDGTDESHTRAQAAIDHLWAFTGEMFAVDEAERALIHAGLAADPVTLRGRWLQTLSDVVSEATLVLPQNDWMQQGGRTGRHSEHLGHLLSELQSMQRTFPGARPNMLANCFCSR